MRDGTCASRADEDRARCQQRSATTRESRAMTDEAVTVLVVDDDPEVRDLIQEALGAAEFAVVEAGDGRAAIDLAH